MNDKVKSTLDRFRFFQISIPFLDHSEVELGSRLCFLSSLARMIDLVGLTFYRGVARFRETPRISFLFPEVSLAQLARYVLFSSCAEVAR
jgi:hypothetical protein